MRAASTWCPWVSGLIGHFVQTWLDSELLSHSAVLALYDPFGVDVPLNCDTTTTINVLWLVCSGDAG